MIQVYNAQTSLESISKEIDHIQYQALSDNEGAMQKFYYANRSTMAIATSLTNKQTSLTLCGLSGEGGGIGALDILGEGGGIVAVDMSEGISYYINHYNSREGGTHSRERAYSVRAGNLPEDQAWPLQTDTWETDPWEPTLGDDLAFDEVESRPVTVGKVPAKHYVNSDAPLHEWMGLGVHTGFHEEYLLEELRLECRVISTTTYKNDYIAAKIAMDRIFCASIVVYQGTHIILYILLSKSLIASNCYVASGIQLPYIILKVPAQNGFWSSSSF
ncbi:uncharacterized protein F5891DRAFT_979289 [Suillus fuscotomentosus]|uniref:Uncharacterized protein n=1 Tax=Suillus fuscotomentosus TaxID=1912939 RepID=A0AAD4E9E7_9AGAM|nr:uncharacterized protein F5891DRAFT_979289 [Suillus fuscotomentosus]KAG1901802.1 hypothetical protein F5891DRAFT_979289 [Suillus fuscotomentosus]